MLFIARCITLLLLAAVLDEATSSLSEEDESYFYCLLQEMGITFLSVGHRSTIKQVLGGFEKVFNLQCLVSWLQYHQMVLLLTGKGQWTLGLVT